MIAKIFLSLTDYPFFRRLMWKPIYEMLAKKFQVRDWHFMNYGFHPLNEEKKLRLEESDEINRFPLQLYHYLASKIKMEDLDILEVGCGRGGGSSYLKRYLNPRKVTGLDIAYNAIEFSKQTHREKGLYYTQGNAENLPFQNEYFDAVINVESCHAYGSVPKFLIEVERVLYKGGYFLCADLRSPDGMKKLRNSLLKSGLKLIEEQDITANVINAIEHENSLKAKRIEEQIPSWFQKPFKEFAGVKGSQIHKDLLSGELVYYWFVMQKI